jgi:hypothetical protein
VCGRVEDGFVNGLAFALAERSGNKVEGRRRILLLDLGCAESENVVGELRAGSRVIEFEGLRRSNGGSGTTTDGNA